MRVGLTIVQINIGLDEGFRIWQQKAQNLLSAAIPVIQIRVFFKESCLCYICCPHVATLIYSHPVEPHWTRLTLTVTEKTSIGSLLKSSHSDVTVCWLAHGFDLNLALRDDSFFHIRLMGDYELGTCPWMHRLAWFSRDTKIRTSPRKLAPKQSSDLPRFGKKSWWKLDWSRKPVITLISTPRCGVSVTCVPMLRRPQPRRLSVATAFHPPGTSFWGTIRPQIKTNEPHFLFFFFLCPRLRASPFISIRLIVATSLHRFSPSVNQQAAVWDEEAWHRAVEGKLCGKKADLNCPHPRPQRPPPPHPAPTPSLLFLIFGRRYPVLRS